MNLVTLTLNQRQVGDVTIVDALGTITLGRGAKSLSEAMRELATRGDKKILINLAGVTYIDSCGIGELVSSLSGVANRGGALRLLNPAKRVRDLLQITNLHTVFQVFDDEGAAVRSFA
jgi:anti-sigma B factor antagonist